MARAALRQIVFGLATTGLLMGCVEGAGSGAGDTSPGAATTPAKRGTGQEIEAPEVFQTTDSALWDGRPSLGGIWVASPDAVDPERVVMFNPATGKSVNGALFRRERDNPGPTLQLSSDAAEALGILAGQPSEIRVTALRRDEPEPEPVAAVAEAASDPEAQPETDPAATAETTPDAGEATAIAAAALEAVDATTDGAADAATAVADGAVDAVAPEPPKKKTWKERRAEAKAAREAKKAAAAAGEAVPDAAGEPVAEAAASPDAIVVAPVETAPLDARSAEVTEAAEAAAEAPPAPEKKTRRQIREEEAAAKAAAEAAAAEAAAEPEAEAAANPAPASVGRPIQIASFSKEENANRAVEALAKIGVTARAQKTDNNGKVVWGVVATGDDALLKTIKGAGFADAFFLK